MQTHSLATQQSQSIYPTAVGKENAAFAYYWTLSKEMGILDHLTSLLRNLYAGQETTELDMEQQTGSK